MIFKDKTFNQKAGFSLVELMTVVIIIGVLATVGVPAYKDYVDRSKVVEAYQLLGTMIKGQRTFYLENRRFQTLANNPAPCDSQAEKIFYNEDTFVAGDFTVAPTYNRSGWDDFGNLVTPGTTTYFSYAAQSGTGDGNLGPLRVGGAPDPQWSASLLYVNGSPDMAAGICLGPSRTVGGSEQGLTPEFFGFTGGVPNDHWVIVAAQANLHPSNDICKYVATSIFASGSSGEDPGMQLGFVEINTNLNP